MNKFLYEYSIDVFSQNGEDGINKEIFEHLSITSGIVLEITKKDWKHRGILLSGGVILE
jgi:hypothetical protein